MLRITKSMSADAAEKYVREALAKSDYYQNAKQLGVAYGKCGERMGIIGDVEHEVFVSLLNNKVPGSEQSWTPRTNGQRRELVWKHDEQHDRWHQEIEGVANRRCGWDLTNNARKSVSIHYAATGDELMLRLFHESNQEAMHFGETFIQTRHKVKGPDGKATEVNQATGNALWVTYIHGETRPIEGKCDMHLHAHNYLLNGTWDESKGRYAAVQPGELYRNAPVIQAHAEQVFVQKLLEHGYQIRETVGKGNKLGWELAHVSDQMIREFSRRTEEIEREARINHAKVMARAEALAERDSIDLADALAVIKAKLGSETRKRKAEATLSPDEQREEWRERVGAERWDAITVQAAQQSPPFVARSVGEARQKAVENLFERQSVHLERDVIVEVMNWGRCRISYQDALAFVRSDPRFAPQPPEPGEPRKVTLTAILEEQERIKDAVSRTRGIYEPLGGGRERTFVDAGLDEDQKAAVRLVIESRDMVTCVNGHAGVGKTRTIREASLAVKEASGHAPFCLAQQGTAVQALRKTAGGTDALTIDAFLMDHKAQESARGRKIFVDEFSLIDNRNLQRLLDLAEAKGASIVLWGDEKQYNAVQRGDPVRDLLKDKALPAVTLRTIRRQKEERLLEVVRDYAEKRGEEAFTKMRAYGMLEEAPTEAAAREKLADAVMEEFQAGHKAIVVAPEHRQGREIAETLRGRMKEAGLLGKEEREVTWLDPAQYTAPQRADAAFYREGHVVKFHRNADQGFRSGQQWAFKRVEGAQVIVSRGSKEKALPLHQPEHFQVFKAGVMHVAEGEHLIITRNDKKANVRTGELHVVKAVGKHTVTFENGFAVDVREGIFARQGYTRTGPASQGHDSIPAFGFLTASAAHAIDQRTLYMTVSRASVRTKLVTDCVDLLEKRNRVVEERESAVGFEDAQQRQERERSHSEEMTHEADLQEHAVKTPEFHGEPQMTEREKGLWERAAVKYPAATRTPELQARIERRIRQLMQDPDREGKVKAAKHQHQAHEWHPGIKPPERGYERSI